MGARELIVSDARLQIGDATVILANSQRFTTFDLLCYSHDRKTSRLYKLIDGIDDIEADIILQSLIASVYVINYHDGNVIIVKHWRLPLAIPSAF